MEKRKARFVTPEERLEITRNRTYTERFEMLMRLIRIRKMLADAKPLSEKK